MKENGRIISENDMVNKFGQMEPGTRDYGYKIKQMVKEPFTMSTEIPLKAHGRMIKQMELAFTYTKMDRGMKEAGKTTSKTAMEEKLGLMEVPSSVNTNRDSNTAKESIRGLT